jgi:hypothetical protein
MERMVEYVHASRRRMERLRMEVGALHRDNQRLRELVSSLQGAPPEPGPVPCTPCARAHTLFSLAAAPALTQLAPGPALRVADGMPGMGSEDEDEDVDIRQRRAGGDAGVRAVAADAGEDAMGFRLDHVKVRTPGTSGIASPDRHTETSPDDGDDGSYYYTDPSEAGTTPVPGAPVVGGIQAADAANGHGGHVPMDTYHSGAAVDMHAFLRTASGDGGVFGGLGEHHHNGDDDGDGDSGDVGGSGAGVGHPSTCTARTCTCPAGGQGR